ncbi:MAG: hypothetical protein V4627_17010 [Pseudomonadota bacterium]
MRVKSFMGFLSKPRAGSLAVAICLGVPVAQSAEFTAYNTYLQPPFLHDDGTGIAAVLVDFLNRQFKGLHTIKLVHMPRARLVATQLVQAEKFDGIGLLLAPPFVGDAGKTRFLWSRPLFEDYNVLIFRGPQTPPYTHLKELKGMTFGSIRGNQYNRLDDMVEKGELTVEKNTNELSNIRKVILGRVDFTQMNQLVYFSLISKWGLSGEVRAIAVPEVPSFQRHIFVGHNNPALAAQIDAALLALPCDPQWQRETKRNGADVPPCLVRNGSRSAAGVTD